MKIKIARAKILDALKTVMNGVNAKSSLPILQNVLLEAKQGELAITSTDLDITIRTSTDCDIETGGSITLPAKLLFASCAKLAEGFVTIDTEVNDKAQISSGNAKIKLQGISAEQFPELPISETDYSFKTTSKLVKELLRKTSYAVSSDATRRTLTGVLMRFKDNALTLVATDGRRCAVANGEIEMPSGVSRDFILPKKAFTQLQSELNLTDELEIIVQKSQLCFKYGKVTLFTKLIDETYPNYEQVIPKSIMVQVPMDRQMLIDALERTSVMSSDEVKSCRLAFADNLLKIESNNKEIGSASDEVSCKFDQEKIEILFNPEYLIQTLKSMDGEEINFGLNSGYAPAMITDGDACKCVVMPLRT